jgi:hypothetical protein
MAMIRKPSAKSKKIGGIRTPYTQSVTGKK